VCFISFSGKSVWGRAGSAHSVQVKDEGLGEEEGEVQERQCGMIFQHIGHFVFVLNPDNK